MDEDLLTARLRGVLNKADQVQASIGVLERDHKSPTDVLEKFIVLAGTEIAHLLETIDPILQHSVARPGTGSFSVAALLPILLRTKHEPEVDDEDRAADAALDATLTDATPASRLEELQARARKHSELVGEIYKVVLTMLQNVEQWDGDADADADDVDMEADSGMEQQAAAAFAALYGGL